MEKRIWVHNPHKTNLHVGSDIVPPGETKDFPESRVPKHLRPAEQKEEQPAAPVADPLAELLKGTVKDVTAELPGMSTADIERLGELEQLGQQRKGILGAIAGLLLTRAANADMLAKVAALTDEDLAAALEASAAGGDVDPDYVAALEAEAAKRNPGAAA